MGIYLGYLNVGVRVVYCLVINSSNQKEYVHTLSNKIARQQNKDTIFNKQSNHIQVNRNHLS